MQTKETIVFPDYPNSLLGAISSVLRHYGVQDTHATLPELDQALQKGPRNVVFMIFDGLGVDMLEHDLAPDDFFRRHLCRELTSVYPSTTAAATTTYNSGLSPLEHGSLGWSLYFKEYCRCIDIFPNQDSFSGEEIAGGRANDRFLSYKTIYERIAEAGSGVHTYNLQPSFIPFREGPHPGARRRRADLLRHLLFWSRWMSSIPTCFHNTWKRAKQDGRSYLLEHAKRIEGGLAMNEKLSRPQFNQMDTTEKQALMESLAAHYDMTFLGLHTFDRWGQSCITGIFEKDGREFVFVPGDTVTLGWEQFAVGLNQESREELDYLFQEWEMEPQNPEEMIREAWLLFGRRPLDPCWWAGSWRKLTGSQSKWMIPD